MSALGCDLEFMRRGFPKLQTKVREQTIAAIRKFNETKHAGGHLEKVVGARDSRIRSLRIGQFYRGIVLIPEGDELYTLLTVLPHDDAYAWAERHVVSVNRAVGRVEFRDAATIEEVTPTLADVEPQNGSRLLDHVSDDVLDELRIDEDVRRFARALTDTVQLDLARGFLPEIQWQVLFFLVEGYPIDEIRAQIGADDQDDSFDPDDLPAAIRRSSDRILLVDGPDELLELLRRPFDLWRVALHPVQYQVVHGDFSGPARVTGGPGTGKTVVAMHRARHLATEGEGAVLLTTFTSTLAASLQAGIDLLVESAEVRDRISVRHIDQVAHEVFRQRHGQPRIVDDAQLRKLWTELVDRLDLPYNATFLAEEWKHVVLAQDVCTVEDYLAVRRYGRGQPLGRKQRAEVWRAVEEFQSILAQQKLWTHETVCAGAAALLEDTGDKPYRHVIVDEAQDLSPARWRMLRALTPKSPNDIFVAGDTHQRIYDHRVSLSQVGVQVSGRSARLTVNYRTTAEILAWCLGILRGERIDDMDGGVDTIAGYRSELHGDAPTVRGAATSDEEMRLVVEQVKGWLDDQFEASEIAVAARSKKLAESVAERLRLEGVDVTVLSRAEQAGTGVSVGTMHRLKGLEFRCLAVVGVNDRQVPPPMAVTSPTEDQVTHRHDLQRERCLLFVACTRAREQLYISWHGIPSPFLEHLST